jgi:hypothetical protein
MCASHLLRIVDNVLPRETISRGAIIWLAMAACQLPLTRFFSGCDQQTAADVAQMKGQMGGGRPGRQYRDPISG